MKCAHGSNMGMMPCPYPKCPAGTKEQRWNTALPGYTSNGCRQSQLWERQQWANPDTGEERWEWIKQR